MAAEVIICRLATNSRPSSLAEFERRADHEKEGLVTGLLDNLVQLATVQNLPSVTPRGAMSKHEKRAQS